MKGETRDRVEPMDCQVRKDKLAQQAPMVLKVLRVHEERTVPLDQLALADPRDQLVHEVTLAREAILVH